MTDLDTLRFPTGPFNPKPSLTADEREELLEKVHYLEEIANWIRPNRPRRRKKGKR